MMAVGVGVGGGYMSKPGGTPIYIWFIMGGMDCMVGMLGMFGIYYPGKPPS